MFVLKVPKRQANKVLNWVKSASLFDFEYNVLSEEVFLYVPLIKKDNVLKEFPSLEFVDKILDKREKQETDLKVYLSKKLTKKEISFLKTSFDSVGSIAILEVPKELKNKEKLIAKSLMKLNKNIKTVLKKSGIHSGKFRTQKLEWLAGNKTKEALHKENNISLKLDVEKVYFSVRSSNERKRIANLVKPKEDVLVMFSGCGPFVCVISKNSSASRVYGVELNPIAHSYALENIRLNHLKNAVVLNGDVREVLPNFYHSFIGLKSSDDYMQLKPRLRAHPKVFEFFLRDDDLFSGLNKLKKRISGLKKKGINVFLHMPLNYKKRLLTLSKQDVSDELNVFSILGELCKKFNINATLHVCYEDVDKGLIIRNLRKLSKYYDYFFFENSIKGCYAKLEDVLEISRLAGLRNLCIDISHVYLVYKNNRKVIDYIKKVSSEFNTYFHVNDSDGKDDSVPFGEGSVDLKSIIPLVSFGVVEVESKDELHPVEMVSSFEKLKNRKRTFDRIVMPLPKSAETFLDLAFKLSKKGTKIHLYQFLKEKDILSKSMDKIESAAKKADKEIKILGHFICGHYSPGTYRVCIDFEVL